MNKLNIKLRDPLVVMKLSRLGSFHQSKLSFLRSFIREFKKWNYKKIYSILIKMVTVLRYIHLKKMEEIIHWFALHSILNPTKDQIG